MERHWKKKKKQQQQHRKSDKIKKRKAMKRGENNVQRFFSHEKIYINGKRASNLNFFTVS